MGEARRRRSFKDLLQSATAHRLTHPARLYLLRRSTRPLTGRGLSPGRFYADQFIAGHRDLIRGECLEIQDTRYISQFGDGDVDNAEVLDIDKMNPSATIFGDLQDLADVASNRFDCLIVTQTLMYVREPAAAVAELFRILAPGGSALVTVAAMERRDAAANEFDAWRFLPSALRGLFGDRFGLENVEVQAYGNVLTGMAHWVGLAMQDLPKRAFAENDADYPVIVTVKATKGFTG